MAAYPNQHDGASTNQVATLPPAFLPLADSGITPDSSAKTGVLIESSELHEMLGLPDLRIVDVRTADQCPDGHIPGAVLLDYSRLVRKSGTAEGLLPTPGEISQLLAETGIGPQDFVVAYDDGPGVDAARLLWMLEVVGHNRYALLNGGFATWDEEELDIDESPAKPVTAVYPVAEFNRAVVSAEEVKASLGDPGVVIVDNRSLAEYIGTDSRAQKTGHIPGAVHFEWSETVDMVDNGRIRDAHELRVELQSLGITPDKHIVLYCQSNRRSAHTWVVLRSLGFPNVRAYTGSWSEWGNSKLTPIEK